MTAAEDQAVHLGDRLASGCGLQEDPLYGGDGGGDGDAGGAEGDFRRLCVVRRSKPAHFPYLRILDLTGSRGAQIPALPLLQRHSAH
jgi:hypothetical protein